MSRAQEDDSTAAAAPEEEEGPPGKAAAGLGSTKDKGKGKKRSGEDIIEREKERSKKAKEAASQKAEWFELKQNTSVYVSGLPSDVTEEEVAQVWPNLACNLHDCTPGYMIQRLITACSLLPVPCAAYLLSGHIESHALQCVHVLSTD